jgi:mono/diheme cytochrome c family protein
VDYPFWDVDIGYGLLMPIIAVVHVFVSHFAIGGGLYLVVAEHRARRASDITRLDFLQRLSRFFVLVSVVFGALTGVGIWFIIGLLSPAATEMLISTYVWAWATEWALFAIEILAALLYFYGWRTMSARSHLIIGWIYFGAAWMSLFVINGIITFMLTPGDWLSTGNIWDGFFNPTFWSSLVFRTGVCIMLAGLYSQLVASTEKRGEFRNRTVRSSALWGLSGLVIATLSFVWYKSDIPGEQLAAAAERFSMPFTAIDQMHFYAALLAVGFVVFGLIIPRAHRIGVAIILMAVGLAWFGAYEWFRESVRKPFVITDHMYANSLRTADIDSYSDDGLLAAITFRTQDDGADLYRHLCRSCHTIDGYRALKPAFDGTDKEFIAAVIRGVVAAKGIMPPFPGTEEESHLLASHIYDQIDNRHMADIYGLEGVELGRKVYEVRCGLCHVMGGYSDKSESLVGLEEEDYHDLLDVAEDFGEEMPAFTGDDREREALVNYLMSLEAGEEE